MNDHQLLVARDGDAEQAYAQVRVTGKRIWKQTRFGQSYQHTQIQDVATGRVVSHSKSTIAAYYRCSCGRVAFHK